ncbi:hypothetical protein PT974_01124 [Cladobotryum mycophilum]|uniref:Uncharacterized protein n=1 Tax=Cladobotryum mycophilum TaxID=491253 RepID=A0ABR0T2V0_9HYPO
MPPITIAQSFSRAIVGYDFFEPTNIVSHDTHISGNSTEQSEAPKLSFNAPYPTYWSGFGANVLQDSDLVAELSNHYLATLEPTSELKTEADVADVAALHIMNPVNLALALRHPTIIKCLNQHTVQVGNQRARSNKTWLWKLPGGDFSSFAVLDFKRVGSIRKSEFESARRHFNNFNQELQNLGSFFAFKRNSLKMMKQAVNYGNAYDINYVALFDWNTLVLVYLGARTLNVGGEWCYVTVTTDKRQMRKALLSFLERACLSATEGEDTLVPAFAAPPRIEVSQPRRNPPRG